MRVCLENKGLLSFISFVLGLVTGLTIVPIEFSFYTGIYKVFCIGILLFSKGLVYFSNI